MCVIVICCELHVTVPGVMTVRDCVLIAVGPLEQDTRSTGIVQLYMGQQLESSRDSIMTSSCPSGGLPFEKWPEGERVFSYSHRPKTDLTVG